MLGKLSVDEMNFKSDLKTFNWSLVYGFTDLVYHHHGEEHGDTKAHAGAVAESDILILRHRERLAGVGF